MWTCIKCEPSMARFENEFFIHTHTHMTQKEKTKNKWNIKLKKKTKHNE